MSRNTINTITQHRPFIFQLFRISSYVFYFYLVEYPLTEHELLAEAGQHDLPRSIPTSISV